MLSHDLDVHAVGKQPSALCLYWLVNQTRTVLLLQLMEFLRSKHPTMAQVLEVVLGDIGTHTAPDLDCPVCCKVCTFTHLAAAAVPPCVYVRLSVQSCMALHCRLSGVCPLQSLCLSDMLTGILHWFMLAGSSFQTEWTFICSESK